uniref:mannan endo-1,4-beta-mannosidase n=1 Tax=Anthurium amnicola TaxID=1678845 RepID=A0A1D1ZLV8_9ARAE
MGDGMDGGGDWNMVEKEGNQFVVDGQPFYFSGFNTYWLMTVAVDPSVRGKIGELFQQASSVGLTVCRTWAFSDGGSKPLQKSPLDYDEQVFEALDFVLSEARKYRIRLILPLCNNWEEYGGKAQYIRWGRAAGLTLTSQDDFYTDPTVRGYYKAYVKAVLNRVNTFTSVAYKDDPTIFAWELMNEPQCPSDPSGDTLQVWIEEMVAHVKAIDTAHLVGVGSEGYYGLSTPNRWQLNPNFYAGLVGTDFIRNHKASGVDFASAHIFPDIWLSSRVSDSHLEFAKVWMESHIEDAESMLEMPVVFGEFGVSSKDKFDDTFRDAFIDTVHDALLSSTRKGGAGGGALLWQLFPEGMDNMDDGYAVVLERSPLTATVISLHSRSLRALDSRVSSWGCPLDCGQGKHRLRAS